ncbi:unnamed protein product [Diatraea saccharalis]|uniref:Phospholipid/glycerol acyltransferase domain-containing protein n=1 Tax=Diatraea saccharalis TaxID=40085 RepID=A0A9N9WEN2_9NEOP|nr:unnamed protein product [Diatraea saccharalis]
MSSFLPDYWSFTAVRTILGLAVGGIMVIGFVIVMEYVGNQYRDVVAALYHVPFTLGYMKMFPTVVRNAAIGLSSMMARLGSMIAPFIAGFRPYGQWCAPLAFGIFPLISAVLCVFLPETKNCELMMNVEEGEAFAKRQREQRALFQCCCNTQLHHYGDYVNPDENTIVILNHRTRIDWNYLWIGLYHATQDPDAEVCSCKENKVLREKRDILDVISRGKSKIKFVLKDELKIVPGLGWIMQLNYFLYLKRNWQEDRLNFTQFADYYEKMGSRYRLILFPEGTDLSEENQRRSEKYAATNNLTAYKFVLHPRTTGWVELCLRLRSAGLASVYDVTVAYDAPAQTEIALMRGRRPKNVYFYFKRYPIEELPQEEHDLRVWLNQRWKEKESSLRHFHAEGK